MFVFENEITKLKEEIEHNNEMFSEFGIKYEKLEKKLEDKSKRLQKRVKDIEQLTAKIIETNGLLDEVQTLADVRPMKVDVGLELDAILAKRREVE